MEHGTTRGALSSEQFARCWVEWFPTVSIADARNLVVRPNFASSIVRGMPFVAPPPDDDVKPDAIVGG